MLILYCSVGKNQVTKQEVPPLSPLIWGGGRKKREEKGRKKNRRGKKKLSIYMQEKYWKNVFQDDSNNAFSG